MIRRTIMMPTMMRSNIGKRSQFQGWCVKREQRGQSLVEGTLVLLIFFMLLFGVVDCGQALVAHQALVERVRSAVRWGAVRPFDGTGDQIANLILYGQPAEPRLSTEGYLGLARANVDVRYQPATAARPDDEMISVAIVNYRYRFLSPWFTNTIVNPRTVMVSAPMAYRAKTFR
jgi:Flp pilus assembly protein TadG